MSRLAVAWTLARPGIDVAIVGTRNATHVDDAVRPLTYSSTRMPSPGSTRSRLER